MIPPLTYIAHRGNLRGPGGPLENTVAHLERALTAGFHVECDVRCQGGELWLGHDGPQEKAPLALLTDPRVWCHAKDLPALQNLLTLGARCFALEGDPFTLTSDGRIWAGPGTEDLVDGCVLVMIEDTRWPDWVRTGPPRWSGLCTDHVEEWSARWGAK